MSNITTEKEDLHEFLLPKNKETSYKSALEYNYLTNRLQINSNVFFQYIKDFIQSVPTKVQQTIRGAFPVYEYQQSKVKMYGIDCTANYKISDAFSHKTLMSYVYGKNIENNEYIVLLPP